MFSIEHEFDATVITLVDEGCKHLKEDVVINAFDDVITVEQMDPVTDRLQRVQFSMRQIKELASALNLPEGVYQIGKKP